MFISMRIMLDNDVLSKVLADDSEAELFANLILKRQRAVLVISAEILNENFSGKTEYVVKRCTRLVQLAHKLGRQFCFFKELRHILAAEFRRRGDPTDRPILGKEKTSNLLKVIGNPVQVEEEHRNLESWRANHRNELEGYIDLDRQAKKDAPSLGLTSENIDKVILDFKGVGLDGGSLDALVVFFKKTNGMSKRKLRRLLREKAPALSLLVNVFYFRMLLGASNSKNEEIQKLPKIDKNNWPDARNIGAAAYCDVFVTEDKLLTMVCGFLKDRNNLKFSICNYETFKIRCSQEA